MHRPKAYIYLYSAPRNWLHENNCECIEGILFHPNTDIYQPARYSYPEYERVRPHKHTQLSHKGSGFGWLENMCDVSILFPLISLNIQSQITEVPG
jgi:hypothetical protein